MSEIIPSINLDAATRSARSGLSTPEPANQDHCTEQSDRLEEFLNEPILLQSEPVEPITPGGIGYERTDDHDLNAIEPRPRVNSLLSVPITAGGISDLDAQSDLESIDSTSSDENPPSSQSSTDDRFDDAFADLVSFLTTDANLKPLYSKAVEVMSAERFQRNFVRLLRMYARHLKREAGDAMGKAIALFVRRSALCAAIAVTRHFFPDQIGETLLHELVTLPPKRASLVEDCISKIATPEEDLSEEGEILYTGRLGDDPLEILKPMTKFMVESEAFSRLRINLEAFLDPAANVHNYEDLEVDPSVAADEFEDPEIVRVLTRRATLRNEQPPLDFDENVSSRTSTGFKETYSDFLALHCILLLWDMVKKYYILSLHFLLSLVPPSDLNRHSKNQSSWKVIYLYDSNDEPKKAMVRLDTGSDLNVISHDKLLDLGMECELQRFDQGVLRSVNGMSFQPRGSLDLHWSLHRNSRIFKEKFFVVEGCPEDVLFGDQYIKELGIISYSWRVVALNVWNKKPKSTDADAAAEKKRQEDKAALQERRRLANMQPSGMPLATVPAVAVPAA